MPVALGYLLFAGPLGSIFSFGALVTASQVGLIGLSLAGQYLLQPRKPDTPKPEDGKYNLRQNVPSLVYAVGRVKKAGDYAALEEKGGVAYHVIVHAGHRINGYVEHWLHDEAATLDGAGKVTVPSHFDEKVTILTRLGLDTETAYAPLVSAMPTIWTADHRGDGLASVLMQVGSVSANNHQKVYPQGMPAHSAEFEGALLYDPREVGHDPDDPDTWEYSENLALIRLWHLTQPVGGKLTVDDLYLPEWIAAADVADELVTNRTGATEPRYHGGFWFRAENDPVEVGRIIDQAGELMIYERADGTVGVHPGEYVAPDIRLTEDDILRCSFSANRKQSTNVLAVRGRYTDPAKQFNTVDAAIYGDPYGTNDPTERTKTIDNQAVQRHNHMQRLQKLAYLRARAPRVKILADYEAAKLVPYRRFVTVHYPPKLDEAVIEIIGRPVLSLRNLTYEFEGIVLSGDPYVFDALTEEGEPGGDIDEVAVEGIPVPASFDVTIERESLVGGNSAAYGLATWAAQASSFLVEVEWQLVAGGPVSNVTTLEGEEEKRTGYLADGGEYRFRARNWSAGDYSEWTSYVTKTAVADITAPGALSGVAVTVGLGHVTVAATTVNDNTKKIRIWYSADATLNQTTDVPVADHVVTPGAAVTGLVLGDSTRTNIALTPDFSADTNWTKGTGWTIAAGVAHHATGSASLLRQIPGGFADLSYYRLQYTVSGWFSGSVRGYVGGASNTFGTSYAANGTYRERLQVSGGGGGQFGVQAATSNFVGDIDNYTIYLETPTCLPQGAGYIFAAAVNASGVVSSSISGPHAVTIV